MAHVPEQFKQYVCENCQVVHAGTPVHVSASEHRFETPKSCGACGETKFVQAKD